MFEVIKKSSVNVYTENGLTTITNAELKALRSKPRTGTHIMVCKNVKDPDWKLKSLEEQYNMIIAEQKILFELTNGQINLFKTGSVAKTGMQLWYDICTPPKPDPIMPFEAEIIESCYNGALIWAIVYECYGFKYDFCSEYPAILRSDHMQCPIDEGELITITQTEYKTMKYFKYGLYHVKIHDVDYRLLKLNSKNWYTHTDLNRALELKYTLEMIEDGKPNGLIYKKFVNGAKLFRPYYDYLFPFKKDGHKCVKKYMNSLAGALSQTDKTTINTSQNNVIYEDKEIM